MRKNQEQPKYPDEKLHTSGEDYVKAVLMLQRENLLMRSVNLARHIRFSKASIRRTGCCQMEHAISDASFNKLKAG